MFHIKQNLLIASAASLLSVGIATASPSWAATIDFSSNKAGDVTAPTPGNATLTLLTGTDSIIGVYPLESFLGVDSGALGVDAVSGSATSFNANAGDSISFNWNFTQTDNDRAFVKINKNIEFLSGNSSTFQKTFDADSSFSIGVIDLGDSVGTSTLQVTNVNYQSAPEPLTMLGSLTACGFGAIMRRRFGKKVSF
jgi:hypothetical protein